MRFILAVVLVLAQSATLDAASTTLTFEDVLPYDINAIPIGYGGLSWSFFRVQDTTAMDVSNSGYFNGLVSGHFVAFNSYELDAMISGERFTFKSAYLAGAWNDDLNIQVRGLRSGAEIYNRTVVADFSSPTLFNFDYVAIDTLEFRSYGGTWIPNILGSGVHFVMDDFTFEFLVPEPTSQLLLSVGTLGFLALRR